MLSLFLACGVAWASVKGALLSGLRGHTIAAHSVKASVQAGSLLAPLLCSGSSWILPLCGSWAKPRFSSSCEAKSNPHHSGLHPSKSSPDQTIKELPASTLRSATASVLCRVSLGSGRKNQPGNKGLLQQRSTLSVEALGYELGTMPLLESKGRGNLQLPTAMR